MTKQMMRTGAHLDAVRTTHIILVFFTDYCEHGGKSTVGSDVVKRKLYENNFSWSKVTGVNCYALVDSCNFFCVADLTWCFVYFLSKMFG